MTTNTCIAALATEDAVFVGADSCGANGQHAASYRAPKVFETAGMLVGGTGSFRMLQILEHSLDLDPPEEGLRQWVCTSFVDAVRQALSDGGWAKEYDGRERGGRFIVARGGRFFRVQSDFSVLEPLEDFTAVGCGAAYALGSLNETEGDPSTRLERALATSSEFSPGVRPPFTIKTTMPQANE